jgi:hypothetical protein
MRPSSLRLVATFVITILVGTASAGPPAMTSPSRPRSARPVVAIGTGLTLLGTMLIVVAATEDACDPDLGCDPRAPIPAYLGLGMIMFGPTLARLSVGEVGGVHLGVRLGGVALIELAAATRKPSSEPDDRAAMLAATGVGMIVIGAITDIATSPGAVRRWNERHALGVVPATVTPAGLAPGLSLTGRF